VDGALSSPILIGGVVAAVAGVAIGLRGIEPDRIPHVGLMSAAFFVASLVHVPLGPSSVHLLLNGLAGIVLGWAVFPAILIALLLQAVFFGYGGLTVLGVNVVVMTVPAMVCYYAFRPALGRGAAFGWGAATGATSVALTCIAVGFVLALSGQEFIPAAKLVLATHAPLMGVEAVVTGSVVALLQKVRPDMLAAPSPAMPRAAAPRAAGG
ncbi:MAG TPA: cobalt transporter CbiM, partial [Rhodospirillales bacterium]|nr:cobalt transporter CbiM [Rhodospirillales bacterium]